MPLSSSKLAAVTVNGGFFVQTINLCPHLTDVGAFGYSSTAGIGPLLSIEHVV
jgi:hypothetical protein